MKKKILLMISLVSLLFAWQMLQVKQVLADSKMKVVTTFYPVYEFTKGVLGDQADISMLIKVELNLMILSHLLRISQPFRMRMLLFTWTIAWKPGFLVSKNLLRQTS